MAKKDSLIVVERELVEKNGFCIEKIIDEHITDTGIGKRNVYTIKFRK